MLCSSADASKSVGLQVKTANGSKRSWMLTSKCEQMRAKTLFYVFVNIDPRALPDFTIVPSNVVARYIRSRHAEWLKGTKRGGGSRKDSTLRVFRDDDGEYLNRWELLGLD